MLMSVLFWVLFCFCRGIWDLLFRISWVLRGRKTHFPREDRHRDGPHRPARETNAQHQPQAGLWPGNVVRKCSRGSWPPFPPWHSDSSSPSSATSVAAFVDQGFGRASSFREPLLLASLSFHPRVSGLLSSKQADESKWATGCLTASGEKRKWTMHYY